MSGRIIDGELEHLRDELRQRDEEITRWRAQIDTSAVQAALRERTAERDAAESRCAVARVALGRAHAALHGVRRVLSNAYPLTIIAPADVKTALGVADAVLSDPTGKAAAEEWADMVIACEAARFAITEYVPYPYSPTGVRNYGTDYMILLARKAFDALAKVDARRGAK